MTGGAQRRLRRIHFWLGLFFAPAIIFFALSGTLQALGFQDRSGGYEPPLWIATAANVHKHGRLGPEARRERPSGQVPKAEVHQAAPKGTSAEHLRLFSVFAALLGVLLAVATSLGVAVGLTSKRDRRTAVVLLAAGVVTPVLLLFLA